ncbi:hypothetical protein FHS31_000827 [Sphingomonas vulcanisoli]|uniref:Uncharacterized protein n=1 Tax=Sphingomonas vulcanisoli TaxID=1658060 RepID=A0ABX0TNY6_9SPHN|nr:hypothetical protein [Sphingomonas vulcanisoli]NIJ07231.1 hypothetical protein [Sphingomonas vulcanisoli]
MFIHVTRVDATRSLSLAIGAIAYLDKAPGGCALRLIGGESLHVQETPEEIIEMMLLVPAASPVVADLIDPEREHAAIDMIEDAGVLSAAEAVDQRVELAKPRTRRK